MADNEIDPEKILSECNERLESMVNQLVVIARQQGAGALGAKDLIKMRNAYSQQINDFMVYYLAATAVLQLVNIELAKGNSDG